MTVSAFHGDSRFLPRTKSTCQRFVRAIHFYNHLLHGDRRRFSCEKHCAQTSSVPKYPKAIFLICKKVHHNEMGKAQMFAAYDKDKKQNLRVKSLVVVPHRDATFMMSFTLPNTQLSQEKYRKLLCVSTTST